MANSSSFFNGSSSRSWDTGLSHESIGGSTIVVAIVAIIGSLICLESLWLDERQKRSSKLLFANFSLATLCAGCAWLVQAYTAYNEHSIYSQPAYTPFCQFTAFFTLVSIGAAKVCHLSIAFHRVICVVFNGRFYCSKQLIMTFLLGFPWVSQVLLYVWPLIGLGAKFGWNLFSKRCGVTGNTLWYMRTFRVIWPIVELSLVCACYLAVWRKVFFSGKRVAQRRRSVGPLSRTTTRGNLVDRSSKIEKRVTLYAFVASGFLLLCELILIVPGIVARQGNDTQYSVGQTLNLVHFIGISLCPWFIAGVNGHLRRIAGRIMRCEKNPTQDSLPTNHQPTS